MRLLLIEDDPGIGVVLQEALVSEGYDVVLAADLDEAVVAGAAANFDLVLTDLLRPSHLSLQEAAHRLRTALGAVPTILLTAYAEVQDWDPVEYGLAAILTKPFDLDLLLAAVDAEVCEPAGV